MKYIYTLLIVIIFVLLFYIFSMQHNGYLFSISIDPRRQDINSITDEINKNTRLLKVDRVGSDKIGIFIRDEPQTLDQQYAEFATELNRLGISQIQCQQYRCNIQGNHNEVLQTHNKWNVIINSEPFSVTSDGSLETPFEREAFRNELRKLLQIYTQKWGR